MDYQSRLHCPTALKEAHKLAHTMELIEASREQVLFGPREDIAYR